MSLTASITLAIAVLGAALGLINTWHQLDRSRVKLRVIPKLVFPVGGADPQIRFCIEVTNLSTFAVTVNDVGVLYKGTESRGAYVRPILHDGGDWPRRLESRTSVTVYGQLPDRRPGHPLRCVYANTACGVTRHGTSPAFKQFAAHQVPDLDSQ